MVNWRLARLREQVLETVPIYKLKSIRVRGEVNGTRLTASGKRMVQVLLEEKLHGVAWNTNPVRL